MPKIRVTATNRESSRLQFLQVPNSAAHNRCLDPEGFHPSRHNPTRHSAVLIFRLLNHDDRAGTGGIRCLKLANMVYPVLAWRESMLLDILCCNQRRTLIFG
jgi:hypothetical protein